MPSDCGPFQITELVEKTRSTVSSSSGRAPLVIAASNGSIVQAEEAPSQVERRAQFAEPILRDFDCPNYDICLSLSAALNWKSFTCKRCCGEINQQLVWRARQSIRQDKGLEYICKLPGVSVAVSNSSEELTSDTPSPQLSSNQR